MWQTAQILDLSFSDYVVPQPNYRKPNDEQDKIEQTFHRGGTTGFSSVLGVVMAKIERHRAIKRKRRPDITSLEALNKISRPAPSGVALLVKGKFGGRAERSISL